MPLLENILVIIGFIGVILTILVFSWEKRYGVITGAAVIFGFITGIKYFPDNFLVWIGAIFFWLVIGALVLSTMERTLQPSAR